MELISGLVATLTYYYTLAFALVAHISVENGYVLISFSDPSSGNTVNTGSGLIQSGLQKACCEGHCAPTVWLGLILGFGYGAVETL